MLDVIGLWLVLAGTTPPADAALATAHPRVAAKRISASHHEALRSVEGTLRRVAGTLLAAPAIQALDDILEQTVRDPEFLDTFVTLARLLPTIQSDVIELETQAALVVGRHLKPQLRTLVRHGFMIQFEAWQRFALPADAALPEAEVAVTRLRDEAQSDPNVKMMLEGVACGFAVAVLLGDVSPREVPVGQEIVRRWFAANRWVLALIDPLQGAIDSAQQTMPEPVRSNIIRMKYAWELDASDAPVLTVWLILDDTAPPEARVVSGNSALIEPLNKALSSLAQAHADFRVPPVFLRLRMASELA